MTDARLLFAGTPEFARASLEALVAAGQVPVAVLTQPDRPAGRGKKVTASPVKVYAEAQDIPVLQPATLRDSQVVEELAALAPDLMIVAAYGLILPQAILDVPRRGCLNVHASLLPRWRGAAPIQQAILNGDEETGVCLMQMDTPDSIPVAVYARASHLTIGPELKPAGELHDRLAALGARFCWPSGTARTSWPASSEPVRPGRGECGDLCGQGTQRGCEDLDWSAARDRRWQRKNSRLQPRVPGAWFELDGERIKCWRAKAIHDGSGPPGVVLDAGKQGVDVGCGDGALRLLEVQRPGRRRISADAFADQLSLTGKRFA